MVGSKNWFILCFSKHLLFLVLGENIIGFICSLDEKSCVLRLGIGFGPWVLSIGIYRGLFGMLGS